MGSLDTASALAPLDFSLPPSEPPAAPPEAPAPAAPDIDLSAPDSLIEEFNLDFEPYRPNRPKPPER